MYPVYTVTRDIEFFIGKVTAGASGAVTSLPIDTKGIQVTRLLAGAYGCDPFDKFNQCLGISLQGIDGTARATNTWLFLFIIRAANPALNRLNIHYHDNIGLNDPPSGTGFYFCALLRRYIE